MRRLLLLFGLGLFITAPLHAQGDYPRAEIFGGYSYLRTDLLFEESVPKGWNTSVTGNLHRNFGIEADFSGHYGGTSNRPGFSHSTHLFMFGPRFAARRPRVTPWGHALFGATHLSAEGQTSTVTGVAERRASDTTFAWAVGAGLDARVHKNVAVRLIQADYVRANVRAGFGASGTAGTLIHLTSGPSNNLRLSFGVVLTWGGS